MADLNSQPSESDFDEDEEYFVIAIPEDGEDDDEIIYPVVSDEEAEALLAEL